MTDGGIFLRGAGANWGGFHCTGLMDIMYLYEDETRESSRGLLPYVSVYIPSGPHMDIIPL